MDRRSRFEWGTGNFFECQISARPWTPADSTVGGVRVAAAGLPASYIVRRDYLVDLTLRIFESEWTDFLAFIVYGQSAQPITWFPDADELPSFEFYLETPAPGERWAPTRDASFPKVMETTLTLRGKIAPPWEAFFG